MSFLSLKGFLQSGPMVKTSHGFVKFIYHFGIARRVTLSINDGLYLFMNKTTGLLDERVLSLKGLRDSRPMPKVTLGEVCILWRT
jgi:hypothetical protein